MNLAFPVWSIQSSIRGRGYEPGLVMLLTFLKSEQNQNVLSDFGTNKQDSFSGSNLQQMGLNVAVVAVTL